MNGLFEKMNDGGPAITYPILIMLMVVIAIFIYAIIKKETSLKTKEIIKHIGWLAVAWGFLGRTLGLIGAFDKVQASGELTPRLLASGLKMALVDPLMGILVFIIARAALLALTSMEKK